MTDDNFHKLALSESFERVAEVAEERAAFNAGIEVAANALEADAIHAAKLYLQGTGPWTLDEIGIGTDDYLVKCFVRYRKVVIEECAKAIEALVISNPLGRDSETHNAALDDALAALKARGLEIREKNDDLIVVKTGWCFSCDTDECAHIQNANAELRAAFGENK